MRPLALIPLALLAACSDPPPTVTVLSASCHMEPTEHTRTRSRYWFTSYVGKTPITHYRTVTERQNEMKCQETRWVEE